MTSKEMLKRYIPTNEAGECAADKDWNPLVTEDGALKAMDEYAKQKCIAFAEWASVNGWYFNKIKRWSNKSESSENLIEVLSATKTTEELYNKFLTETSI